MHKIYTTDCDIFERTQPIDNGRRPDFQSRWAYNTNRERWVAVGNGIPGIYPHNPWNCLTCQDYGVSAELRRPREELLTAPVRPTAPKGPSPKYTRTEAWSL